MVLHTREVFLYCWKATDFYMKVLHEMADATEEMLAFMEELRHLKGKFFIALSLLYIWSY